MAKSASRSEHRANQLLATLAPADFVALEPHLETVKLSKSTTVYETGDDMPYAYFPHDAVVSLITVLTDGKTVEVAVFGREALLGLTSALATCRSLGRYVVQVSGTASRVDTEALRRVLKDRPAVRELCLRFIEALMAQALQSMACNTVHSVEARCCRWLLTLHDRVGRDTLPLTHDQLSRMLGGAALHRQPGHWFSPELRPHRARARRHHGHGPPRFGAGRLRLLRHHAPAFRRDPAALSSAQVIIAGLATRHLWLASSWRC